MRRAVLLSVLTLVAVMVPIGVVAPADAANRYVTYVACGLNAAAAPSHSCDIPDNKAAFFKSKDTHVHYKVCVKYPDGTRLCAPGQNAPKGALRHNKITSGQAGQHKVTWFVAGKLINTWFFNNREL